MAKIPLVYRRVLSEPVSKLLDDPLSELTRTRQTTLLIVSSIALLISLGIATINEISTLDVKLAFDAARIARWPLFALTAYLIIVYLLGAVADLTAATAKGWSLLASVNDTHARMIADQRARGAIIHERVAKSVKRMETLSQLNAELKARGKELEDQLASKKLSQADFNMKYEEMSLKFQARVKTIGAEADEDLDDLPNLDVGWDMADEYKDMKKKIRVSKVVGIARIILEVVFPIAYGTVALVLIWRHH